MMKRNHVEKVLLQSINPLEKEWTRFSSEQTPQKCSNIILFHYQVTFNYNCFCKIGS